MALISFYLGIGESLERGGETDAQDVPCYDSDASEMAPFYMLLATGGGGGVERAEERPGAGRGGVVAGREDEWRFAEDVAAQEADGWPLQKRLLWRMGELTNAQSIDLGEHIGDFPEVSRGFTIPGFETRVVSHDKEGKLISKASIEDGGSIVVTGGLWVEGIGEYAASFKRRLQFAPGWAVHEQLVIAPEHRGKGIAPRFLLSSFALYDKLELEEAHVVAGLETGRWYWAHMGFDFMKPGERDLAHGWANEVCSALGVDCSLGPDSSAGQIARLDCEREVSLEILAQAMPNQRKRLEEEVAETNGMAMGRPISLGRAIMLTGPEWRGFLQLQGPHRLAFEEAAAERMRKASRAGGADGVPSKRT
jgi:GNAT superfamily N-acetyltransferase